MKNNKNVLLISLLLYAVPVPAAQDSAELSKHISGVCSGRVHKKLYEQGPVVRMNFIDNDRLKVVWSTGAARMIEIPSGKECDSDHCCEVYREFEKSIPRGWRPGNDFAVSISMHLVNHEAISPNGLWTAQVDYDERNEERVVRGAFDPRNVIRHSYLFDGHRRRIIRLLKNHVDVAEQEQERKDGKE